MIADQDFATKLIGTMDTGYEFAARDGFAHNHAAVKNYINKAVLSLLMRYSRKYPDRIARALEIYKEEKGKIKIKRARTRTTARRARAGGGSKKMPRASQDVIEGRRSRVKFEVKDWLFRARALPKI